jgi:putative tryptophan/tyrosine transport system substrate-binding protein
MIGRRAFCFGALAAELPLAAVAQPANPRPLVAWIGLASAHGDRRVLAAFRQGLAEAGRIEGQNIRLVLRHADGAASRLPALIAELEAMDASVFIAGGRAVARELVRATRRPIVALRLPADDTMLYASLARPGGNLTGLSNFSEELAAKRIEILKEFLPDVSTIGLVYAAPSANAFDFGAEAENAASARGLTAIRLPIVVPTPEEAARLVRSLRPAGVQALLVVQDFVTISLRDQMMRIALEEKLATVTEDREFAENGALVSYGADLPDLFRRAASYVDRILKGADPGELPIQLATKFELVLNLKTARAIGLTVPPAILARADEVIE